MLLHCCRLKNVCSCRCICIYGYSFSCIVYISLNLDLSLVWPFLGLSEWAAEGVYLCVHVERFIFQPLRFLFTIFFSPSILNE